MRFRVFVILGLILVSATSLAASHSVEVIDDDVLNVAKAGRIQKIPLGYTRIVIGRNEQRKISMIVIEQKAEITESGVALEITNLLADLVEGDALVDSPVVHLHQDFTLSGAIEVKGLRFSEKSERNDLLLKNIDLDVIQNVPLVSKGQTWTSQAYAMAHILDFEGFNEIAGSLASGRLPQNALGEVARFPGADGIFKRINVSGQIGIVKGRLVHIALEKAMLFPVVRGSDCEPDLEEKKPTLH